MNNVHVFEAAGLGKAPFEFVGFQKLVFQACPEAPIQCGGSCDYCGTAIMNAYILESSDGKTFKVGCDCIFKAGDAGLTSSVKKDRAARAKVLRTERRAAQARQERLSREQKARVLRKATRVRAGEFAAQYGLVEAFKVACRKGGSSGKIARELLGRLRTFGALSERAVELVKDLAKALTPAPTGRVEFTGVIKSTKAVESMYGTQLKMLVAADSGFKVWTTVPNAILAENAGKRELRGQRVKIKATLTPSKDDAGFAFGSRPNGKLIVS